MTHVAADFPKVSCTVRLKRFGMKASGSQQIMQEATIHPEVAGGPRDVSNPKAFSVLQDSVWGDFLFVILFFCSTSFKSLFGSAT